MEKKIFFWIWRIYTFSILSVLADFIILKSLISKNFPISKIGFQLETESARDFE